MKNKLFSVLAIAALVFAVTACDSDEEVVTVKETKQIWLGKVIEVTRFSGVMNGWQRVLVKSGEKPQRYYAFTVHVFIPPSPEAPADIQPGDPIYFYESYAGAWGQKYGGDSSSSVGLWANIGASAENFQAEESEQWVLMNPGFASEFTEKE